MYMYCYAADRCRSNLRIIIRKFDAHKFNGISDNHKVSETKHFSFSRWSSSGLRLAVLHNVLVYFFQRLILLLFMEIFHQILGFSPTRKLHFSSNTTNNITVPKRIWVFNDPACPTFVTFICCAAYCRGQHD